MRWSLKKLHRFGLFWNLNRTMSNKATTHLERTADVPRSEVLSRAIVVNVSQESSTVKKLRLRIENENFSFQAGQWVDFIIPSLDTVGGFSMCSSPNLLKQSRMLDLAVKASSHPPADWIHNKCKVGDEVTVKAGGNCIWDAQDMKNKNTLLIAGGIGINPIFSILQQKEDLQRSDKKYNLGKTVLLYSASTKDELIFKELLDLLANDGLSCKYFVTKDTAITKHSTENNMKERRITAEDVAGAVDSLRDNNGMSCFICGPPPMIKCIKEYLKNSGINESDINYEQWW